MIILPAIWQELLIKKFYVSLKALLLLFSQVQSCMKKAKTLFFVIVIILRIMYVARH